MILIEPLHLVLQLISIMDLKILNIPGPSQNEPSIPTPIPEDKLKKKNGHRMLTTDLIVKVTLRIDPLLTHKIV